MKLSSVSAPALESWKAASSLQRNGRLVLLAGKVSMFLPSLILVLTENTVYGAYLEAGRWVLTGPWLLVFMVIMQSCQVFGSYTLVWWEAEYVLVTLCACTLLIVCSEWNRPNSFFQILYACLGIGQAVFTFLAYVRPFNS